MEQLSDASSYCQHLKSLSDQLVKVGAPVSNEYLVLQPISVLIDAYVVVWSHICHANSLSCFYKAFSMIIFEETTLLKKVSSPTKNSYLMVFHIDSSVDYTSFCPNCGGINNNHGGRSNGRIHHGRGRGWNNGHGGVRAPY